MRFFIVFALFLLCPLLCYAQLETKPCEKSSAPCGRYEIVQSSIRRSLTFRIDKETGSTWMLTKDDKNVLSWSMISRDNTFFDNLDVRKPDTINYQLFIGGIMARDCFLINVNTGVTWILTVDDNDNYNWDLMSY